MSLEIDVLRALFQLTRRHEPPPLAQLADRLGGDEAGVRRALFALAHEGLVQRTPAGLRLTLAGLAVAVAFASGPEASRRDRARSKASSVTLIPRRRAPRRCAA